MPEAKKEDKALNMLIPLDWHEWLRDEAYRQRVPIAELVRIALERTYPSLPKRAQAE